MIEKIYLKDSFKTKKFKLLQKKYCQKRYKVLWFILFLDPVSKIKLEQEKEREDAFKKICIEFDLPTLLQEAEDEHKNLNGLTTSEDEDEDLEII